MRTVKVDDKSVKPANDMRVRTIRCLVLVFCLVYAYFFQGGGWGQNSRFDLTRAIVEKGTFEISSYASNTGDLGLRDGKVYSNKSPGMSLLAAPVYAVLLSVDGFFGIDPRSGPAVNLNAHILTFFLVGLPSALLIGLVCAFFLDARMPLGTSVFLSAAFGLGTLVFPWAGVLNAQSLLAFLLFLAWFCIRRRQYLWVASAAMGVASFTDYIALPVVGMFVLWGICLVWRDWRSIGTLLLGPVIAVLCLMLVQSIACGGVFSTSYSAQNPYFRNDGLFLGVFDWPDLRRVYWLTLHPFRGLLFCCPALIPGFLGVIRLATKRELFVGHNLTAIGVMVYFLVFNLCFNGWTGGWGIGPRYLLPAVPFIFVMVTHVWRSLRLASLILMPISVVYMFAVTAVQVMIPSPNRGVAIAVNPVFESIILLVRGKVSISTQHMLDYCPTPGAPESWNHWDSYNLGEVLGLGGIYSLIPLVTVLVLCIYIQARSHSNT